jgi:RimJ/RimL family protein N-acetyltransferase
MMVDNGKVVLRNKRMADAREDYLWQKDPELARLDATYPLSCTFEEFARDYAGEVQYPETYRHPFAIETAEGRHIGNCVYYNVDDEKREAEIGIMIGERAYWSKGYGTEAMVALIDRVFRRTRLSRLYLKTLTTNLRAQKSFGKCGMQPCGFLERDGYKFLLMEISRREWDEAAAAPRD